MRVLITGCGFVGYNLALLLTQNNHTVFGMIHREDTIMAKKLKELLPAAQIFKFDLLHETISPAWFAANQIDAVIHTAAQGNGALAAEHYQALTDAHDWQNTRTMKLNFHATRALAEQFSLFAKSIDKILPFVFISSIYAANTAGASSKTGANPHHAAQTHYGCSKRFAEEALEEQDQLAVTVVRYPRVLGPHQHTEALAVSFREKLLAGDRPNANDALLELVPVSIPNQLVLTALTQPTTTSCYQIVSVPTEQVIKSSPLELAQCLDDAIIRVQGPRATAKCKPLIPMYQLHSLKDSRLLPVVIDVVEARLADRSLLKK